MPTSEPARKCPTGVDARGETDLISLDCALWREELLVRLRAISFTSWKMARLLLSKLFLDTRRVLNEPVARLKRCSTMVGASSRSDRDISDLQETSTTGTEAKVIAPTPKTDGQRDYSDCNTDSVEPTHLASQAALPHSLYLERHTVLKAPPP